MGEAIRGILACPRESRKVISVELVSAISSHYYRIDEQRPMKSIC